jgi:uncharacterized protein (DUF1697 family)
MSDLRRAFEGVSCTNVATYIQSGNVLFQSRLRSTSRLSLAIEEALSAAFAGAFPVVIVPQQQLDSVVHKAPAAFGSDPVQYRYDVAFLRPPLRAGAILPTINLKTGVDEAWECNEVLYFRRLTTRASQSHLPRLTRHAAYSSMTIRNWNTVRELHRLIR